MVTRRALVTVSAVCLATSLSACSAPSAPPGSDPRPRTPTAGATSAPTASAPAPTARPDPSWRTEVPERTRQVIRTVSSDRWCARPWCTTTQAWERRHGTWVKVRELGSTIGPNGWGKRRQDDGRTPEGIFQILVVFSTTPSPPGPMPWRRRLPTSTVSDEPGPTYNTWIEEPGRTDGDRPSMRWGFVVDYNNVRLRRGVGPAPVPDAGSGIFYHTSRPGHRWEPSEGCTRIEDPDGMRWLLRWLRPGAHPRVVQNR